MCEVHAGGDGLVERPAAEERTELVGVPDDLGGETLAVGTVGTDVGVHRIGDVPGRLTAAVDQAGGCETVAGQSADAGFLLERVHQGLPGATHDERRGARQLDHDRRGRCPAEGQDGCHRKDDDSQGSGQLTAHLTPSEPHARPAPIGCRTSRIAAAPRFRMISNLLHPIHKGASCTNPIALSGSLRKFHQQRSPPAPSGR